MQPAIIPETELSSAKEVRRLNQKGSFLDQSQPKHVFSPAYKKFGYSDTTSRARGARGHRENLAQSREYTSRI